jgi:hypothetical protein
VDHNHPHPPVLPGADLGSVAPGWWQWLRRRRHWTVPALLPLGFLAVAALAHQAHARVAAVAICATVTTLVAFFASDKWDRRSEVAYAITSGACWTGWITAVTYAGVTPWTLIPLAALAIAWGIPWYCHKRPREKHASAKIITEWDTWWQHHAPGWDLSGSRVTDVILDGGDVMQILVVQLWAGRQTTAQVQSAAGKIESALRGWIRPGMLRVRADKHDASKARILLRRENPLGKDVTWDPGLVPATITRPAPLGRSESGQPVMAPLLSNWFIIGASRSGKSNELSALLATITGCPDALTWLIDMKGGRAARPWLPAVDWLAVTIEEARVMLAAAAAEVSARAMNAYDGHEQLRPTPAVPALFVVVDETHEVTSDTRGDTTCARLLEPVASMGMGVAVYVIVVTQYGALCESVRTEQVRMNLLSRMCFRVTKPEHGAFALSDWDRLNPARLEAQGEFYWQAGPEAGSEPGRGPHMPHDLVRQIAARNGAVPRRPLVLYASDHQEAYDMRWTRLPAAFRRTAPQTAAGVPLPRQDTPPAADARENTASDEVARARLIEEEVAATPDGPLVNPPDSATLRAVLARQKALFARALRNAPPEGVTPGQLKTATGLSRSWVQQQLRLLTDTGAITKITTGHYRETPGRDTAQAMDEIRDQQARLLATT